MTILLLAGCSSPTSLGLAEEICEARFSLIDIDPNSESGAPRWYDTWEKTMEIRNSPNASDKELQVASSMDDWFNAALDAVKSGLQWPIYGDEFGSAGLELNEACQPFD